MQQHLSVVEGILDMFDQMMRGQVMEIIFWSKLTHAKHLNASIMALKLLIIVLKGKLPLIYMFYSQTSTPDFQSMPAD